MVNVAGRSKACHTCRTRRVTCGQEKPECRQCVRLGYVCGGYAVDRIFIHFGENSKAGGRRPKSGRSSAAIDGSPEAETRSKMAKKESTPSKYERPRNKPAPDLQKIDLSLMYRQQLFQQFLSLYLPKTGVSSDSLTSWYLLYPTLQKPTIALETAIMALSTVILGHDRNDEYLVRGSWQCYIKGLGELQKALWNPELMYRDETLGATMALAMYELAECPSDGRSGYTSHVRGLTKLVAAKGPNACASQLRHGIFRLFRAVEILHALDNRRHTFLADQEWLDLPWTGLKKSLMDQIIDVIVCVSNLIRDADDIWKLPTAMHAKPVFQLILEYWKLDARLRVVEQGLQESFEGEQIFWHVLSTTSNPTDDDALGKVFPVAYSFKDPGTAHNVLLLWTAMAMTRSALERLSRYLRDDLSGRRDEQAAGLCKYLPFDSDFFAEESWIYYTRNACQCVEYFLQRSTSGARMALSVPLNILAGYLEADGQYPRETRWVKSTLEMMGRKGMRLLLYWR